MRRPRRSPSTASCPTATSSTRRRRLLPYVYGAWAELVGEHWLVLRALSLVLGLVVAVLLYATPLHALRPPARAARERALRLLDARFHLVPAGEDVRPGDDARLRRVRRDRAGASLTPRAWLAAGAFASLGVQTRSLVVGAAVAFAWEALRSGKGLLRFAVGFAVALVPTLVLFALDPHAFLFGNLGVHGVRSESGFVGNFEQKAKVVANLLGIATESRPVTQYLLLGGAAVVAAVALRRVNGRLPLWFLAASLLALVALIPTPTYTQYFATTIPFLIVGAVELVALVGDDRTPARVLTIAGATWLALYLALAPVDLYRVANASQEDRPFGGAGGRRLRRRAE